MSVEGMLRDIGRIRRQEAQRIMQKRVRRAQLRENLKRTVHTAIWLFATVALAAWMLSW